MAVPTVGHRFNGRADVGLAAQRGPQAIPYLRARASPHGDQGITGVAFDAVGSARGRTAHKRKAATLAGSGTKASWWMQVGAGDVSLRALAHLQRPQISAIGFRVRSPSFLDDA